MSDGRRELPAVASGEAVDRSIIDRITDAFFALDEEWRFTYLNDRAEEMLDRSREGLIGRVIWDEFPETVETQFPKGFHRAMETQEPVAFEVFHKPLDTWFEARAYPSDSGLTVSLRDVTDRKDRERDLERYETVVETIHDGIVTLDADDEIQFVNSAVERTFDVDRSDLVGRNITALPSIVDIDPEAFGDMGHALDMLRRGDADFRRFEFSYTNHGGESRVAETRMVSLGDGEIVGIIRDVTEQREHERVVRSLHSITPELLGADNRLETCSIAVHAAGEVLDLRISGIWLLEEGLNRLDPVAGTAGAHEELGGLPHFPHGEGLVWEAFRKGEPQLYEDLQQDGDGATPLRSEIVVPIGEHGVLMAGETRPGALDETDLELATILAANTEAALDREEREGLLRRSKNTLERQNERLEVVETVLSEDLRDQLAIAARAAQSADADEVIEPLMRARRLADDALELSKGEFSVGPRGAVEIGEVARTASDIVDGVSVEITDGGWLRADRERLVRMFETLFLDARNRARERSDGDDGAVTVEIGVVDQSTVYVEDDAPPPPENDRDHLFELHTAADSGPRHEPTEDSSGLGLAVAGEIATAHGWEIDVVDGPLEEVRFEIGDVTTLESAD